MVKKAIKKLKHPFIVFCGHHYCGKSYSAKLIRKDLDIAVNLNKYDFITRIFLYLFNINPIDTNYNWIDENYIDYQVINNNYNKHIFDYAKDSIMLYKGVNKDIIKYVLENIFQIKNKNFDHINDNKLKDFYDMATVIYNHNHSPDMNLLFNMTVEFYNKVICEIYDFSNKYDMFEYLSAVIEPYKCIQDYSKRINYYAYSLNEVLFFKEKYNSPIIWIDMDHVIRSNILATNNETDKLKLLNDVNYKKEMADIKKASTAIINNNYDFKRDISNKIKSAIQI